jgi:signal transduction histidine kinase
VALPLLTTIKAIRTLSQDEGARGYPVRVRGTVTHFDEVNSSGLVIHDGEFGQFVIEPAEKGSSWNSLRVGDLVEIEGKTARGGFAPNVTASSARTLGRAPLPQARRLPYPALLTGRYDCDFVELEGVIQRAWLSSDPRVRTMFADVAMGEGVVRASFWNYSADDLKPLIDARVRLRGTVGTLFGRTEQLRGVSLFAGRTSDVVVLEAAPDPFALPTRSIRSIYNYSPAGEVNRRIRVQGVVTGYVRGRPIDVSDYTSALTFRYVRHVLYLKDGTGAARVESELSDQVRPGDVVEVAGFPAVTPGKPILRNAVFRVTGRESNPSPTAVATSGLLTPEYDAELVRMDGELLSVLTSPTERVLVLKTAEMVFEAGIGRDEAGSALDAIRPGSVVSVVGVYSFQSGPPPSFRLFLRAPADVNVLAAAPWWTLRHTAVTGAMLLIVACALLVLAKSAATRRHQQFQVVLDERTRVARELHDTLEQGLAGIGLQLEAVAGTLPESSDAARQSLDVARHMLRYSLEEARRSVMDLRSQALERSDLIGALEDLARQLTTGTGTQAHVRVEGEPRRLDAAQEHHLLRIGLEAVTNALKHANASRVDIELAFRGSETDLVVCDDGCGLDGVGGGAPGGHFGLQGIRERVDKLGGRLRIESVPGKGTRLVVTVPTRGAEPRAGDAHAGWRWRTS